MSSFFTFSHPIYDAGHATNYRLPPRFARPLIATLVCARKGHAFTGSGTANGTWSDAGTFQTCSRCAIRRFDGLASRQEFQTLLATEHALRQVSPLS